MIAKPSPFVDKKMYLCRTLSVSEASLDVLNMYLGAYVDSLRSNICPSNTINYWSDLHAQQKATMQPNVHINLLHVISNRLRCKKIMAVKAASRTLR